MDPRLEVLRQRFLVAERDFPEGIAFLSHGIPTIDVLAICPTRHEVQVFGAGAFYHFGICSRGEPAMEPTSARSMVRRWHELAADAEAATEGCDWKCLSRLPKGGNPISHGSWLLKLFAAALVPGDFVAMRVAPTDRPEFLARCVEKIRQRGRDVSLKDGAFLWLLHPNVFAASAELLTRIASEPEWRPSGGVHPTGGIVQREGPPRLWMEPSRADAGAGPDEGQSPLLVVHDTPPRCVISGETYPLTPDGLALVRAMLDSRGSWVTAGHFTAKPGRVFEGWPLSLREMVERTKKGYRLRHGVCPIDRT